MRNVSIVITSYNYGRYLHDTIGSVLNQTYAASEVIVVDDGSTDNSREVIECFGNRIKAVFKQNGGQASAMNAAMSISHGDAVCFVDSDDLLFPTAIERAMEFLSRGVVKVHWPLQAIDEKGAPTGAIMHEHDLAQGDLRESVIRSGPDGYVWQSTSGNVWSRDFLEAIGPIPEDAFVFGPDVFLSALAPFYGSIARIEEPQGAYRLHGSNTTCRDSFPERVCSAVRVWEHAFDALEQQCTRLGLAVDRSAWAEQSWWHRTESALNIILRTIPRDATILLMDAGEWVVGGMLAGRLCLPFLERDGEYWGPPEDDTVATRELERMRHQGAQFVVILPPTFWWLDHYGGFADRLLRKYRVIHRCDNAIIVELNGGTP